MWGNNTKATLPTGSDIAHDFICSLLYLVTPIHDDDPSTHCGLIKYSMLIEGGSRWRLRCIVVGGRPCAAVVETRLQADTKIQAFGFNLISGPPVRKKN